MAKNTGTARRPKREPTWDNFVQGADIGVEGRGPTQASSFEQAALALTAVITGSALVEPVERIEIACKAPDPELLLADWLNALIYEMATRRMLFGRFRVTIAGDRLLGTAWGQVMDLARHQPAVEVKGASYTEISVTRRESGTWTAHYVVDV